jgi:hypothetical protein
MHTNFCAEALREAIVKHGPSEIFNTDQRSRFPACTWIITLREGSYVSRRMAGDDAWTMSSSNSCGAARSRRISVSKKSMTPLLHGGSAKTA